MMANEMFNYLVPDVLYDSLDVEDQNTWKHCYERISIMSPVKIEATANGQFVDRTECVSDWQHLPEFEDERCSLFLGYGKPNGPVAVGTAMLSITDDSMKVAYVAGVLNVCFMNEYPKQIIVCAYPYNHAEALKRSAMKLAIMMEEDEDEY